MKRIIMFLLMGAALGAAFAAGWVVRARSPWADGQPSYEIRQGGYEFINPLLECEGAKATVGGRELKPFNADIETLVHRLETGPTISSMSVYFRDLNNGPWFGINYSGEFSPASLLKVPNMVACLKQAERDRQFLKRNVFYRGGSDANAGEHYKPEKSLEVGRSYTIDELLMRAIVYSDNNANNVLLQNLDLPVLEQVYRDLGVTLPQAGRLDGEQGENFMTVKAYSSFFRVLFNASYLGRDMSEKALTLLSQTTFREGLVGGVPQHVKVAHKFGERVLGERGAVKQLHDCGIIYYPESPYLLCIMTRGSSFEYLDDAIRTVSRAVYAEVDRQHR